jgi:hypothetical protein
MNKFKYYRSLFIEDEEIFDSSLSTLKISSLSLKGRDDKEEICKCSNLFLRFFDIVFSK